MLTYFRPDTVLKDVIRFASKIKESYNIDNCSIYQEDGEETSVWIGYDILKGKERIIIKMLYDRNQSGELAIKEKGHLVTVDGVKRGMTSPTLGEAFSLVGIRKK